MADAPKLTLYIANKNYSSWSFRAWIAMRVKSVPFTEHMVPLDDATGHAHFIDFSPSKRLPALKVEEEGKEPLIICESLAILDFIADLYPEAGLWPEDRMDRALARSHACEMHAGFVGLRTACPMNMRRAIAPLDLDPFSTANVVKNIQRIEQIWSGALARSGGPFLFGEFGVVDAMFAPIINRIEIYALSDSPVFNTYKAAMKALPAWKEWEAAAREEKWVVESDEV